MTITAEQLIAAGAFVTAISGATLAIIREVRANRAVTLAVAKDTAVVLGHVNSEKSIAAGREETLKAENALLREIIADKKATDALLAQSVATNKTVVDAPAIVVPPGTAAPVLAAIEANTSATAENTKKTEAKVDALKAET